MLFQILLESKLSLSESIVRDKVDGNEMFFVGVDAAGSSTPPYREYVLRYDLVLTTYGQFTRMKELAKLPFHAVIADEAQTIKNPGSGQIKAVRSVVSPRRLSLTGTPVENRLTDLWSIFDFVNPGLLGGITAFRKQTDKTKSPGKFFNV